MLGQLQIYIPCNELISKDREIVMGYLVRKIDMQESNYNN